MNGVNGVLMSVGCVGVLVLVALQAAPRPGSSDAEVKIAAVDGAASKLHFQSDGEHEEQGPTFSFVRSPASADEPAALHLQEGDVKVLTVSNGTVEVHTDLVVPEHGDLAGHLANQNATQLAQQQELEAISGVVTSNDALLEEHAQHFDSFMQVLEFMQHRHPHFGVYRQGQFSFTCSKTFYAAHDNDDATKQGTRRITLAAIRNIVGHWGSVSIEATLTTEYYMSGVRKYLGYWNYAGTGNTGEFALTGVSEAGTLLGSISLVDGGLIHRDPHSAQSDLYQKFVVLDVQDYAYMRVDLTISTTYGHVFATSTDSATTYSEVPLSTPSTVWFRWGEPWDAVKQDRENLWVNTGPGV